MTKFLKMQSFMLLLVGYNRKEPEHFGWKIYTYVNLCLLIVIIWPEMSYVTANISDVKMATDGLCPLLFGVSSLAKLLTMRIKKPQFYKLIKNLTDLWGKASDSDLTFLDAAYKADNRLSLPYILSTSMVGVLYLVYPIATSSYEYLSKGSTTWVMPMRSIFVYDLSKFPYYELTYLWFAQSTFLSAFGATGIDTLFYAASFNLSGHFQVIQNRFCHIQYEAVQQCSSGSRIRLSREFLALIRYHNNIIDQCNELTNVYKPILFCHFLISSMQICVIAYQLTLPSQELMGFITYTTFLMAITFQCFVYCHGGTRLEVESEAVASAIYESAWYQTGCSTQRSVCICLRRSQKCVLISSVFFNASLPTFTSIISSAGSYIALLQTVSK